MKKIVFLYVSVLLITLIVYGGSGVNVYFFCCDACRSDGGIKAVVEHGCCERHHHNHEKGIAHEHENVCCSMSHQYHHRTAYVSTEDPHTVCGVERVSVNWQTAQSENLQIAPFSFDVFSSLFFVFSQHSEESYTNVSPIHYSDTQKPPDLSKDIYFSLLNTLII